MNLHSVDKRWWQSLQSLNSCKTASMQHQRAMFWAFSDQLSIGLSVESIDSSHRHFLSRPQPRFLQETLQLHQSLYFQQQALSRIESISGCTFNIVSGFEESPAQRKHDSVEWMKANPTRSAIVWIDFETLTLTFREHFLSYLQNADSFHVGGFMWISDDWAIGPVAKITDGGIVIYK